MMRFTAVRGYVAYLPHSPLPQAAIGLNLAFKRADGVRPCRGGF